MLMKEKNLYYFCINIRISRMPWHGTFHARVCCLLSLALNDSTTKEKCDLSTHFRMSQSKQKARSVALADTGFFMHGNFLTHSCR